jgi:HlyD family secretion protein
MRIFSQTPQAARLFRASGLVLLATSWLTTACAKKPPTDRVRASGQVEATEVQVSAPVGGRVLELNVAEGDRVAQGALIARLDAADADLARLRAVADKTQAEAQLRLLQAGPRSEDVRQAQAQVASADADASAAAADLAAAEVDVQRFESLLASDSGSRKQRDDAVTKRDVARDRVRAARERVIAAQQVVTRLRAGARREEIEAASAHVAATDAQIAIFQKAVNDAIVTAPVAGIISTKIADAGETLQPRAPLVVITDLDHAWASVYVDEPSVPRLRVGQPATIFTDAGGPGISGIVSFVADKAEFTPRNVQTAEDRSKLVYRVKVSVDNKDGVLKPGMPVEAELPFAR